MKMAKLVLIGLLLIASAATNGQVINPTGIGLRINPDGAGFDTKIYLDPHVSLEGQLNGSLGFYYGPGNDQNHARSYTAVGLVEYNIVLPDPSWRIFLGPGLHAGSWDRYDSRENEAAEPTQGVFGIDAILGVEYLFKRIPLGLSVDAKPSLNLSVETAYFPDNVYGFTARYYFGHKVKLLNLERRSNIPNEEM